MNARTVIRLAILLGERRNQIAAARKVELAGLGTSCALWRIPHARNRNRSDLHAVPLAPLAEKLFAEAALAAKESPYIFPSSKKRSVALHADTVTYELTAARNALNIAPSDSGEEVVLHELRHMFKTKEKRLDSTIDIRCRIQNHGSKSASSGMELWYDHAATYGADRAALQAWENRLTEIIRAATPEAAEQL
jgi:hypothetical protein